MCVHTPTRPYSIANVFARSFHDSDADDEADVGDCASSSLASSGGDSSSSVLLFAAREAVVAAAPCLREDVYRIEIVMIKETQRM